VNNILEINHIDVVIPVYNGEKFIMQALESVVNQTLSPRRIIVIDDGSTDNTNQIVTEYIKTSKIEIKIIKKENGGLSSARNRGVKESTSPFIAFLDADDTWEPNKLEEQLNIFITTEYKNLGLVYCNYDLIDTEGEKDLQSYKVPLNEKLQGNVFKELLKSNKILSSGSGVLIKREVFEKTGVFDENLKFGEDWDMWLRIAKMYEVSYSEKVLTHIRRHNRSMTSSKRKVFMGELAFYKKWIPIIKSSGYQIPIRWRIKVLYRLLTQLPSIYLLKESLPILFVNFYKSV